METTEVTVKQSNKRILKQVTKTNKKRGGLGVLKGKIHCDDAVFNLGL